MNTADEVMDKIQAAKKISAMQPELSFDMCKEAYAAAKAGKLKPEEGYALVGMALACRSMTKLNECLEYSLDALKLFERHGDPIGQIRALNLAGIVYFYHSLFDQALEYFLRAIHLLDETEDRHLRSSVLNNVGEVYREAGNSREAMVYYGRALEISRASRNMYDTAGILNNLGQIYFDNNDLQHCMECYRESYDIMIVEGDIISLSEIEDRMGKVHFVKGEFEKAREYYNSALRRLKNISNNFYIIDVLIDLACLELEQNEQLFLYYLERAIDYAEKANARKKLSQIYRMITGYYEDRNAYKEALDYLKRSHQVEQEIEASKTAYKLEIIKIELGHLHTGKELEKISRLNRQLEMEIAKQKKTLIKMEKKNRNLRIEALFDELTGIPNRRSVKGYMSQVWKECGTKGCKTALFIIDIDHFKLFNDQWGHLEGDTCLIKVARRLKDILGGVEGIFGRYGGEEFVCFVKDIRYNGAEELAGTLRKAVEKLEFSYSMDAADHNLTISIGGIYGGVNDFKNVNEMFRLADAELYRAKNSGRNRVFIRIQNPADKNLLSEA